MSSLLETDRRVLALALARMADVVGNSFLIVVLPVSIAEGAVSGSAFGLTQTMVTGVVLSLFGFLNSFTQPFACRLSDRTGKRKAFILFGLAVLVVTNVAYAFAGTYLSLTVVRALQGVGVAFTIPCTIALVNELATTDTRAATWASSTRFACSASARGPSPPGLWWNSGRTRSAASPSAGSKPRSTWRRSARSSATCSYTLLVSDPERTEASAGEDLSVSLRRSTDGPSLTARFRPRLREPGCRTPGR